MFYGLAGRERRAATLWSWSLSAVLGSRDDTG